jgi:RNA polymerase sigma-70 factor (ECF subfamily)
MRRSTLAIVLVLALASLVADAQDSDRFAGRPLAEVLADLQAEGLQIVFSSAVVTPTMVVEEEPHGDDPRSILDQVLRAHGLRAEVAPGGQILILVATPATGSIRGIVTVGGNRVSIADLVITVDGSTAQAATFEDGRFVIDDIPAGRYTVKATSSAFMDQSIDDVRVKPRQVSHLRFDLVPVSVFLNEVIVTPSHFRLLEEQPESRQFLSREEVQQMPHAADDLYRAVKRLPGAAGGDSGAAEDVVQTTFMNVIRKISTYRGEAALFTWLCTFCRYEIAAFWRRRGKRMAEVKLVEDSPAMRAAVETFGSLSEGNNARFEREELARLVWAILDHLPVRYGNALQWKYIHGLSVREIAARSETSPKAVESLLTRARQAFRDGFSAVAGG